MLMELGVFKVLEHMLGLYSIVAVAWVGALVADLVINKPLGLSPPGIEFKRAHLYDINPVGVGAMAGRDGGRIAAFLGVLGTTLHRSRLSRAGGRLRHGAAIACVTKGRYYIARAPRQNWSGHALIRCVICEHRSRPGHGALPGLSGPICSLCCTLETRCRDCASRRRASRRSARHAQPVLPAGSRGRSIPTPADISACSSSSAA